MPRDSRSPGPARSEPSPQNTPDGGPSSAAPPFLPLRTAVVLLTAAFIGVVMGGLAYLSERSVPPAVAIGLAAAGTSSTGLRNMIG
ncbi:hypothetical protein [Streptomyces sp. NBC_01594]|uniref:hypothetical protein n=1 Tax=Streptomyces sp. NBC_01594 TaxID=2975890 RepID=UPI003867D833